MLFSDAVKSRGGGRAWAGRLAWALVLGLALHGCGYSMSVSPYGLVEPVSVKAPMVRNHSRLAALGPLMTQNLITRLDTAPDITVTEAASDTLSVDIKDLVISGGAWEVSAHDDTPTGSASRIIYLNAEAVLTRTAPDGSVSTQRRTVSTQRTFLVGDQVQTEMRQNEALSRAVDDVSQKIAQMLFSQF